MAEYLVGPDGDWTSVSSAVTACINGTLSNVEHTIYVEQMGTEPSTWNKTGSGAGLTRTANIYFKPVHPSDNGGTAVDIQFTKAGTWTNCRALVWDCSESGDSRFRWRGLMTLEGGNHGWSLLGDSSVLDSGPSGHLDGDTGFYRNHFVQYGMLFNKNNDDVTVDGVGFIMRKSGTTTGTRGYNNVPCFKFFAGSTVSRPSENATVSDVEVGYYAADGIQIVGLKDSSFSDIYVHDLFPTGATFNKDHIDGFHIVQATDCTFDRIEVAYILYQGLWVKNTSASTYTADNDLYSGITGCRFSHITGHHFGGDNLTGRPNFDPNKLGENNVPLKNIGGTGIGMTNVGSALVEHCVFVEAFKGAGLEHNWDTRYGLSEQTPTIGDMNVDYVNNVFKTAISESGSFKTQMAIGDPGFDGTWKNNLQLSTNTNATYLQVPDQTGDLARGTTPLWDADYRPLTGSPLIDAGYSGALSTGITPSTTDYEGTTWVGSRNIGLFETAGGAPTLNAEIQPAGTANATVDVVRTLSGANSTASGTITYLWSKQSGTPGVTFTSTTAATAGVTLDATGAVVIRLTVSTVESPGTTDSVDITVTGIEPDDDAVGHFLDGQVVDLGGIKYWVRQPVA